MADLKTESARLVSSHQSTTPSAGGFPESGKRFYRDLIIGLIVAAFIFTALGPHYPMWALGAVVLFCIVWGLVTGADVYREPVVKDKNSV